MTQQLEEINRRLANIEHQLAILSTTSEITRFLDSLNGAERMKTQVKDIRDSFVYLTPGQRIIVVPLDLIAGSDERSTGGMDGWQWTSPRILNALKHSLKPDQAISSTLSNLAHRGWRVLVWSPVDVTGCLKAWRMENAESVSQLPDHQPVVDVEGARADRLAVAGHRIISVDELKNM